MSSMNFGQNVHKNRRIKNSHFVLMEKADLAIKAFELA